MNPILLVESIALMFLAIVAAGVALAWRSSAACGTGARLGISVARGIALLTLAVPFLNPGQWIAPPVEGQRVWAILVDTSASMATTDGGEGRTRLAAGLQIAGEARAALAPLDTALLAFDAGLRTLDGEGVAPAGESTDIVGAIGATVDRYRSGNPKLEGIVLVSDGRQVAATPFAAALGKARAFGVPVFPVMVGGPVVEPDVEVVSARRQITAFKGQQVVPVAQVKASNAGPRTHAVRLENAAGEVVAENVVNLGSDEAATVRFDLDPLEPGYHLFRFVTDGWAGERNTANNEASFAVHVTEQVIRVLLVEGSPYWDTKFIAQLLQRDRNFRFEVVYRLSGERFFAVEADQGGDARPEAVERTVFPATAEAIADYDLIVFGHSVEYFLDDAKIAVLREWVEKRGGALVFARGKPVTTELPALAALYPTDWDVEWRRPFHWQPTYAGVDTGLFGTELPGADDPVWRKLPPLASADYGSSPRPFSQVLAEGVSAAGDREARFPVVVSRRIGEGLVVSINSDDLWRWDFFPKFGGAEEIYRTFWPQLFNWTLAYSDFLPGQNFALKLSRQSAEEGRPLRARILRRPGTEPDAAPILRVRLGGDVVQEIALAPNPEAPDAWEALLAFDRPGLFQVELWKSPGDDAQALSSSVLVTGAPTEASELGADPEFLARIAKETGGRMIERERIARILEDAGGVQTAAEGDAEWRSAWNAPWWLVPMLGFFGIEWFLRRRNGLI